MAIYDSPWLLARCKQYARRPATDQAMPDTAWYSFLTDAQAEVFSDLFSRYPDLAYSAPVLLTTADGGRTYTFGLDASGDPIRPMGHTEVYDSLAAIPDSPLVLGDDFLLEGGLLRVPGNATRAFSAGPYARFVLRPDREITAAQNPTLQPKSARMLLVWKALEAWASRPGSGASPSYYAKRYEDVLFKTLTELATAYNQQAAQGNARHWYSTLDLLAGEA